MHVGIAWEGHHVHRRHIDILSHLELLVFPTNSFCFFTSPMWLQDDCKACTKKKPNSVSLPSQYMPCARVQSENACSTFVQFFPSPKIPWKSGQFVGLNHLCLAAFFGCFCHRLESLGAFVRLTIAACLGILIYVLRFGVPLVAFEQVLTCFTIYDIGQVTSLVHTCTNQV